MKSTDRYPKTRWLMLSAIVSGQIMIGTTLICYAPILGVIAKDLGVSVGEISAAAMGVVIMASGICAILSGPMLDKIGVARSITMGALVTLVGMCLVPVLSGNIKEIIFVRIIMGIGFGPVSACTSSVAAKWFPEHQRGMVAGMIGAGISLGIILGFILTPAFMGKVDHWSMAIGWLAIVPAVCLVTSFLTNFIKEPQIQDKIAVVQDPDHISSKVALAFKSPSTYIGILSMFLFTWVMNAFNDLTPGYIAIDPPIGLGFGPAAAGQYMSAVQIGMLLGSAASGLILMKLFKGNIKRVMMTGFFFAAIFCFSVKLPFVYETPKMLAGCLFLVGFFEAFIIPMVATFIAINYPAEIMGRVFGTTFGVSIFGGAIGVFVGSTFLHTTGNYMTSITIVSAIALLGVVVSFLLNSPKVFQHVPEDQIVESK